MSEAFFYHLSKSVHVAPADIILLTRPTWPPQAAACTGVTRGPPVHTRGPAPPSRSIANASFSPRSALATSAVPQAPSSTQASTLLHALLEAERPPPNPAGERKRVGHPRCGGGEACWTASTLKKTWFVLGRHVARLRSHYWGRRPSLLAFPHFFERCINTD